MKPVLFATVRGDDRTDSFEWGVEKDASNLRKHGVRFREAVTAFRDPFHIVAPDPDHSRREERFLLLGRTLQDRVIVVVFTRRGENVRVIGSRLAQARERKLYEEGQANLD